MTDSLDQYKEAIHLKSQGHTITGIAAQLGVNRRTVQRWFKSAENKPAEPKNEPIEMVPYQRQTPKPARRFDESAIVDDVIANLVNALTSDRLSVTSPGVGSAVGALVKLMEYRRKIQPPTAKEWAEQAIALGISPHEIARELRDGWRQQA